MKQLTDITAHEGIQIVQVALKNHSAFMIWVFEKDGYLHIAIEGYGCYKFATKVDTRYVADKLRLLEGDAEEFAEWINREIW